MHRLKALAYVDRHRATGAVHTPGPDPVVLAVAVVGGVADHDQRRVAPSARTSVMAGRPKTFGDAATTAPAADHLHHAVTGVGKPPSDAFELGALGELGSCARLTSSEPAISERSSVVTSNAAAATRTTPHSNAATTVIRVLTDRTAQPPAGSSR